MALPSFAAELCGAAWNTSGNPGITTANTGAAVAVNDALLIACFMKAGPVTAAPVITVPSHTLSNPIRIGRVFLFYVQSTGGLASGSTISVNGAWAWAALSLSGFALGGGKPSEITMAQGHVGNEAVVATTRPTSPRTQENVFLAVVGWEGEGVGGKATTLAGTELTEQVGVDTDFPAIQHALRVFRTDLALCGEHTFSIELAAPDSPANYWVLGSYWPGNTSSACVVPGDGTTRIALPTGGDVAPSAGSCPVGYNPIGSPVTNCAPYPTWYDLDFCYLPGGGRLVACCPHALNAAFGQLWVVPYDDAWPPNAGTPITILSSGVSQCSLLATDDGLVTLFYRYNATGHLVRYRLSRDQGATWETEQTLDPGLASWSIYSTSQIGQTGFGLHSTPVAALKGGLAVLPMGIDVGVGPGVYLVVLRRNSSGGWDYAGKHALANAPSGFHWQATRDGSVQSVFRRWYAIQEDGSHLTESPVALGTTNGARVGPAWLNEEQGIMLRMLQWWGPCYDTGNARRAAHWNTYALNASGNWEIIGTSIGSGQQGGHIYEGGVSLWGYNKSTQANDNQDLLTTTYQSAASALRCRPDGVWEFLRPNPDGELQFARAFWLPDTGGVKWEGA